uniref:Uncharacterized protein n=1 Tax=Oryza punctata TaxID=4537 RepID=A0A0E0KFY3_ORYPU
MSDETSRMMDDAIKDEQRAEDVAPFLSVLVATIKFIIIRTSKIYKGISGEPADFTLTAGASSAGAEACSPSAAAFEGGAALLGTGFDRGDAPGAAEEFLAAGDIGGEAAARLGWRFSWSAAAAAPALGEATAKAESDRDACRFRFRLSISMAPLLLLLRGEIEIEIEEEIERRGERSRGGRRQVRGEETTARRRPRGGL